MMFFSTEKRKKSSNFIWTFASLSLKGTICLGGFSRLANLGFSRFSDCSFYEVTRHLYNCSSVYVSCRFEMLNFGLYFRDFWLKLIFDC